MVVKLWLMVRVKGTVILKIWRQVLFLILWTVGLLLVHNFVDDYTINFPQTLIPVLGVVTGLLLVFRTNTAYDRYYEGRKIWSTITLNIRHLTRCFWVMTKDKGEPVREIVERTSAVNLLVAFAYATKNYIREKYSHSEKPLDELIAHLPKYSNVKLGHEEMKKLFGKFHYFKAYDFFPQSNIPIEISHHIAAYIRSLQERELVDSSTLSAMNTALNNLVDCVTGLERILRTPIPLAYSVHLHHALWIYLLALPIALIGVMNWFTIPAVGFASFALLGMLSIGWEIENPFGLDDNDLPVNDFCDVIHSEVLRMTASPKSSIDKWAFCEKNRPCYPVSDLCAEELANLEEYEVRQILKERFHNHLTRKMCGYEVTDLSSVKVNGALIEDELKPIVKIPTQPSIEEPE